ncbi:MAG: YiiX/YebB-like N1pC/P60 family cysteine hydrolase [Bacteroidales bacterium]|jgi:hypothetical protein|nr:YiiX/YebB-like N1pC/P60 family cysteine hydrolase [Bacteroidales bacterium]
MRKVFCLLCIVCLLVISCKEDNQKWQKPSDLVIQTGDLVFREGESVVSNVVKGVDRNSSYSHVGLVIWFDSSWQVVHAVPNESKKGEKDKVKIEPLGVFFATDKALSGGVYRLDLEAKDTIIICNKVKEIMARNPLFDTSMDLQDTNSFYCTELVWHIFRTSLGIDLSQGNRHNLPLFPDLIFCSDIISNPELRLVYQFNAEK